KACGSRQQLVQEAKLLGRKFKVHRGDAGDVTPRLVDGSDESSPDRVSADLEDDRNCRSRGLGHKCCWCVGRRGDDGNSALNQFGCQLRQPIAVILGPVYSVVTFRPSTNPTSLKPCRNASTNSAESSRAVLLRNPTTGIEYCCARAASGHAAAPASPVMNSRRFIQSPRRRAAGTAPGW